MKDGEKNGRIRGEGGTRKTKGGGEMEEDERGWRK